MRLSRCLFSTTALIAFGVAPALATAQTSTPVRKTHQHRASASHPDAVAAPSMMGNTAPTDMREDHIAVTGHRRAFDGTNRMAFGGGLMQKQDSAKSVSAVSRDFIARQVPGADPMQLIALLPGANVGSIDPMGLSGSSMSTRGLDQAQMGFTLEGFPINDIGSFQVYSQEIVDSENLSKISLAQGSADLDSPHLSATGGVVDMYMIDPKYTPGGMFDVTYGSYDATRGFLRLDTGKIGQTNLRAYFSGSYASENINRTVADQRKLHAEAKFVNDWGQGNRVSLAIVGNRLYNYITPNVTQASWDAYGYGVKDAYISPKTVNGVTVQNTVWNSSYNPKGSDQGASYYKLHQNPFTNIYASAPSTFTLTDHLTLTETPYFWYGSGSGGGAYPVTLNKIQWGAVKTRGNLQGQTSGNPLLYNPSITTTYRPGAVTKLTLTTGINRLMVGYWFEYAKQSQTGPYTGVGTDGNPWDIWGGQSNSVMLANGQPYMYRNAFTQTHVHTMFIGDSISLLDKKLTIDAGLKFAIVTRDGTNRLPNTSTGPYIHQTYREPLPTAAIRYQIDPENQIFVSGATNFRMPTNSALYDSGNYYAGSGYSTHANVNQHPEISISEEAGYRYTGQTVMGSVTYFHYDFTNRLFTQNQCQDRFCNSYFSTSVNAGGQTSNGVDAEIGTRPILYHLRPYASFEYVDARLGSNLLAGKGGNTGYLSTRGKFAPETPKYQVGFNLDYDDGSAFASYNLKYVARQFSSFMNDQSIPGYVRMNVNLGYRFHSVSFLQSPTIKLNLTNITDKKYLAFVKNIQTNAQSAVASNGQTIKGSAPTYLIGAPFAALATVSAGF